MAKNITYTYVKGRKSPHCVSYYDMNGKRKRKFFEFKYDAMLFENQRRDELYTKNMGYWEEKSYAIIGWRIKNYCLENYIPTKGLFKFLKNNKNFIVERVRKQRNRH